MSSSYCSVLCRCLGMTIFFFFCLGEAFYLCMDDSNKQIIFDLTKTKKNQIMVVGVLHN